MNQVRSRLEAFAAEMFAGLPRSDQRAKGELYIRGLMLDGQRKSMQPMAERLGVDHQQLQQFVSSSTWDHTEVRSRLATWAHDTIAPDAHVIDDVGFPKDGLDSPGVARMYCGALGKTGNCQVGVSVHLVTDRASAAVDWRLFLPASWDPATITDPALARETTRRRQRCKIGDDVSHREKWRLALDMLDEIEGWGLPDRPVVSDAGYGDITAFRLGLDQRGRTYVVAVKPTPAPIPPTRRPSRWPTPGGVGHRFPDTAPTPLISRPSPWPPDDRRCARSPGDTGPARVPRTRPRSCGLGSWRCGCARPIETSPGALTAVCPSAGCRSNGHPARPRPPTTGCPPCPPTPRSQPWCDWPRSAGESSMTTGNSSTVLGLDHFEGRTYVGWHRHVTLTSVAQAFCTMLRLDPTASAPA
jgi:SRSO17 transposase